MRDDFIELTRTAEQLVEAETGLEANGSARVKVLDRPDWAQANIAAFRRLLNPLSSRLASNSNSPLSVVGRAATGTQLGLILGWMSTRVLGQYDLLLLEDERPEDQDFIYYVGPNVLALEKRYAFPPREFRLWLALHECAHRAQFTGVDWLTEYFRQQVHVLLETADPEKLSKSLKRVAQEVREGDNPISDGGLLSALASPEQQQVLKNLLGLMSLLEGHGEVTMARAGKDLVPNADRFHRVLHARRARSKGIAKAMQKVLGMDAKLRQYAEGARFIERIEIAGGKELMAKVWEKADFLPSYDEIRDPQLWISRVQGSAATA